MNITARSKRTKFRKEVIYASLEEAIEAKMIIARKHLEGVDLSFFEERKKTK
ncbi:hypothetical protein LXM25_26845 [Dyadobacter sp. LJ53]|uniref:hypothetical protein n=1 Tax=Dyadobacter chenwenxiniae TaxID=2906456 RepID=UPI001F46A7FD|nr:hypothetical protein [Dyadobacter chenwenxiniae]MCF0053719.1 hypothetical protein [Dyadobacter chenwenxiniae]